MAVAGLLAGCGGGKKTTTGAGVPTSISLSLSSVSLNMGNYTTVAATVLDGSGVQINPAITPIQLTFSSSNPAVASVTPTVVSGATAITTVCAGGWDANFVVCSPPANAQAGTADITVKGMGLTGNPIPVFVHQRVDRIVVSPASVDCRSQGQTQQFSAQAFGNGVDLTSTVGPFTWTPDTAGVVTIDNSTNNGLATATAPGKTNVFASLPGASGVASTPATFVTCPVQKISMHVTGTTNTSVTLSVAQQQPITVDAVDSQGVALKNLTFTFNPAVPSVGSASATQAIASAAGSTGVVTSCSPPTCNPNLFPVYSNVFTVNVSGTSASTVYAASTGGTSLIPINSDTAGTAVTLPSQPNSMRWDTAGNKLYLGSSAGLITVDPTATTAPTQNTAVLGQVLAISPDSTTIVTSDTTTGTVYLFNAGSSALGTASIAGATRAAFAPDGSKVFILAGNTLYVLGTNITQKTIALGSTGADVNFAAAGWFGYVTQGGTITARATCDNSLRDTIGVGGAPTLIQPVPDGSKMLAVNSPAIDVITINADGAGCPPALSDSVVAHDFGQGSFTANQLVVLRNSSKAYVISPLDKLLVYDIVGDAVSTIPLAGGATATTGGATVDSAAVYVGGSDNAVHKIDVASAADTKQIPLSFTPDLVAVRPR